MCVAAIVYKPVSLDDLKEMDSSNPDGGGVAWFDGTAIQFRKGLRPKAIHAMQEAGEMTYPYLLHFRWATMGAKVAEWTHPFPIGMRALCGELEGASKRVLIHNGTWGGFNRWIAQAQEDGYVVPPDWALEAASDTALAAWLIEAYPEILSEVQWATALASVAQDVDGVATLDIELRGTWSEHEGNQYSNLSWLPWSGGGSNYSSNKEFWKAYAKSKGWAWGDDEATPDLPPATPKTGSNPNLQYKDADSWEEYVRLKYGDETAQEERDMTEYLARHEDAATLEDGALPWAVGEVEDEFPEDLVSDDPEAVNAWLAERMVG